MRPFCALRPSFTALSLLLVAALGSSAPAQVDDCAWGNALSEEFGFDDMAEKLLRQVAGASDRPPLERRRGRLGLCSLRRRQARREADLSRRVTLFGDALSLMQKVVGGWPKDDAPGRQAALYRLSDLRAERARTALTAAALDETSKTERARLNGLAAKEFQAAQHALRTLVREMGDIESEEDIVRWRTKGRAWLQLCWQAYERAMALPERGSARPIAMGEVAGELDEFILFAESGGDVGVLPSLHGYVLLGRARTALSEPQEADAALSSVIDTVLAVEGTWPRPVQDVLERGLRRALELHLAEKAFEKADGIATRVDAAIASRGGRWHAQGRVARVRWAAVKLGLMEAGAALKIASDILEETGTDFAAHEANALLEALVNRISDPKTLAPDALRAAARSANSRGGEARRDAIRLFRLLITALPRVANADVREQWRAEAYYDLARAHWSLGEHDEAIRILAKGAPACVKVEHKDLNVQLAKLWRRMTRTRHQKTPSARTKAGLDACTSWLVKHSELGFGTSIPYERGRGMFAEADRLETARRLPDAARKFEAAAKEFAAATKMGGPLAGGARLREARSSLRAAEAWVAANDAEAAAPLLEHAAQVYRDYLTWADRRENRPHNQDAEAARQRGRNEARYSIGRADDRLLQLLGRDDDPARVARRTALRREIVEVLRGYEARDGVDERFAATAAHRRFTAHLALGDLAAAEADYGSLAALKPKAARTLKDAYDLGLALRRAAVPVWKKAVGDLKPARDPAAWQALAADPAFQAARLQMVHALDYLVVWLTGQPTCPDPRYWDFVTYHLASIGAWSQTAELVDRGLSGHPDLKGDLRTKLDERLLVSACLAADAAYAANNPDDVHRLRAGAERAAKNLKGTRAVKRPSISRLLAGLYGGTIHRRGGIPSYDPGLARFQDALPHWTRLLNSLAARGHAGSEAWWEAKWSVYHLGFRIDQENGQNGRNTKKRLAALQATHPAYGGKEWQRWFDWLELQAGMNARLGK
ncbi:MAG: hypothetical protein CMJ83_11755 [Planctomycetes bacterium]|nr:hypothetical protein [Planctomycetota bacterium]